MSIRSSRRLTSGLMTAATAAAALLVLLPLVLILFHLVVRGASSLDWNFFVRNPRAPGEPGGGVANAIVGSAIVVGTAAAIGLPLGVGAGIYLAEFGNGRMARLARFVADVLNGTPSIVVGVFVWTWMVRPMGHFSGLAGAVALAVLMVPMVTRTTEEIVRLVPGTLREAALALGYPLWRASLGIVVRSAWPGIVTGSLVAMARIAGETAPLLFTALGNLNFRTGLLEPMQTLSLQIYVYATGPFAEWHRLAWGAALVLITMVILFGMAARYVTRSRLGNLR